MPQRLLLLIDNERYWLNIFSKHLERFNYNIITAATGAEGLAMAEKHRPACILLDFHMPDADGLAFAAKLKENPELRKTPIILVSADETQEYLAQTDYLLDGFFLKGWPFERAHCLVQSLLRLVNRERGTITSADLALD